MPIQASDEQMKAIIHGANINRTFEFPELPTGVQEIPDWCKGLAVDWHPGYNNSPSIKLKVTRNIGDWDNKEYSYEGNERWVARHPDGRACVHAHGNAVDWVDVGRLIKNSSTALGVERVPFSCWATEQRGGYGGAIFQIKAAPGTIIRRPNPHWGQKWNSDPQILETTLTEDWPRDIALRGPYHVGAPKGYQSITFYHAKGRDEFYERRGIPWYKRGGSFGVSISEDLLFRLFAKFAPTHRLARVTRGDWTLIEPVHSDWDVPKDWLPKGHEIYKASSQTNSKYA